MGFKDIFNKIIKRSKNNKVESDESYCYSSIIWSNPDNLIILLSFTEDYFEQIIELQDAINNINGINSKIVFSSYDEVVTKKDENDKDVDVLIIHKRYYILIGGPVVLWENIYMNIHDLGNIALSKITDEITNNCESVYFKNLIDDGILTNFSGNVEYDMSKRTENGTEYTDPEIVIKRLPNGFTGRDIVKFINIISVGKHTISNAFNAIKVISSMDNKTFKNYDLYPLYAALFKNPTVEKLSVLLEPLYKQPDDDSIPGDVSDETLDEIFRERYERFSAVADESMYYEDIDEELANDEESENIREGDIIE